MEPPPALSAAQRAKVRRLSRPRELSPDEEGSELNIVPFLDIIVNILIFVLATVAVTFTATITTSPPASGGVRKEIESSALNLTVIIVNDGFSIKASGGNVAPGCAGVGPGLAIPRRGGEYDYAGLNTCVARLKHANADFATERQAFINANPGTPYQEVVHVADALRASPSGEVLFDEINFKVSR